MKIKNTLVSFMTVMITVLTLSPIATPAHANPNPLAGKDPRVINTILNNFNVNLTNRYLLYDPNPYMSNANYKKGTKVLYTAFNTSLQFKKFPTGETSTRYGTRNVGTIAKGKVIKKKLSDWGIIYYQVKFNNIKKPYWVLAADLNLTKNPNKDNTTVTDAENQDVGLNYVNYIRDQHGLEPLTWNDHLYILAQERNQQLSQAKSISHYAADGSLQVSDLIKQHGWNEDENGIGENIANIYPAATPTETMINMINEFTYNDAVGENWVHRDNILSSIATQMAMATIYSDGIYYQTMLFE